MPRPLRLRLALACVAVVLAACETTPPVPSPSGEPAPTPPPSATASTPAESPPTVTQPPAAGGRLAAVQSRGKLVCGVNGGLPGFSVLDETSGSFSGFDVDFCRAIAAAVLGDADAVEYRTLAADQRAPALQAGDVDVLIRNTTWTVTRDATWGTFAPTTFYDGQGMMVTQALGATTLQNLAGATICVQSGTTTELNLTDQMRALGVDFEPLVFSEIDPTYQAYEDGRCDAVTSDRSQLVARRTAFANPGQHVILDIVMSKEPLGPVVPAGDTQWFNVVKWVVFATIEAEEQGVTSANAATQAAAPPNPVVGRLLGAEGELGAALGLPNDWVVGVITAVGNYGEIYDRNLGPETPFDLDRGPNALWTEGGLLYAPPYR